MKSATTVVAPVLTLLVWASVAAAGPVARYRIDTPAPDGQASCTLLVGGTNPVPEATLTVVLNAVVGEAQIPELGLGDGVQDGCDIFPETSPSRCGPFPCVKGISVLLGDFVFEWTLDVHAHPGANCEAAGLAGGHVAVTPPDPDVQRKITLDVTVVCE